MVAEEIKRLNRQNRKTREIGDELAEWVLTSRICSCRRQWVCPKCELLRRWEATREEA